ncbi:uncharacterized protein LOC127282125 [Leptopilina boulardi]|uniref:uncharacterized protein LOC127282125 n=1 Tax=Leptopilina boulardi TaxID=63433 RepID=UPI0021F5CA7B|nr:uncharacterized protein LOC127282125 [Leptopilina boulardi]
MLRNVLMVAVATFNYNFLKEMTPEDSVFLRHQQLIVQVVKTGNQSFILQRRPDLVVPLNITWPKTNGLDNMNFQQLEIEVTECTDRDVIEDSRRMDVVNQGILVVDEHDNDDGTNMSSSSDESMVIDEEEKVDVENGDSMEVNGEPDSTVDEIEKDATKEGKEDIIEGSENDMVVEKESENNETVKVEPETENTNVEEGASVNDTTGGTNEEDLVNINMKEHLSHFI